MLNAIIPETIRARNPSDSGMMSGAVKQTLHNSRVDLAACLLASALFSFAASRPQSIPVVAPGPRPADAPPEWKQLLGEYGPASTSLMVLERSGKLVVRKDGTQELTLQSNGRGSNFIATDGRGGLLPVRFMRDASFRATSISFGERTLPRRKLGPDEGQTFRISPARPLDELRKEALATQPPHEDGKFREPDLLELAPLDPSIHLDIRYATDNDFLGTPVYTQARAFLQRPATEALLRALHRLRPFGYGLLIHDAYRPWYVTKIFWDATPPEGKIFVADPSQGSRHNRGCAVDLTLYDLQTGHAIEMPGTYDEMSPRSFPDYPGGTSLQRWHRDLLRWAMESEGFTVYEHEWWHFDFKDWRVYPVLNVPFEKLQLSTKH
jgi:D-alanyl-D-alanine dipeptidase